MVLNGTILAVAGIAAALIRESEPATTEDPDMIPVPRAQWELLQRRLGYGRRKSGPDARVELISALSELDQVISSATSPAAAESTTGAPSGATGVDETDD